jgi:hypothetical protein
MRVFPPGSEPAALKGKGRSNESGWKALLKANENFLRTAMRQKLTSGEGGSPADGVLSDSWKAYFKVKNKYEGSGVTTTDQAVAYMLERSADYKENVSPKKPSGGVHTNPFFFFKPEQIIKDMPKYAGFIDKYKGLNVDSNNSGSAVCGVKINARTRQRASLQYSVCAHTSKKKRTARDQKTALKACGVAYNDTSNPDKNKKFQATDATVDRTDRKLKARVKRKVESRRVPGDGLTTKVSS